VRGEETTKKGSRVWGEGGGRIQILEMRWMWVKEGEIMGKGDRMNVFQKDGY
jgi:hypothetical protein